ncbi:hypothetical protein OHS59_01810 [Streptomyces sp. NBC_00414]|uniref:hypothetical protein n=1 Tax=Streptomyces sp. NBC_00414 TaxID=2975739 RepID=UPI002E2200BB
MLQTRELLDSLSAKAPLSGETLAFTIDVLSVCEEAVTACAAGMTAEHSNPSMASAITLDLDCGDVVLATRRVLTGATGTDAGLLAAQLEACMIACQLSHDACGLHAAHHEHCRLCAEATQQAADACRTALAGLRG